METFYTYSYKGKVSIRRWESVDALKGEVSDSAKRLGLSLKDYRIIEHTSKTYCLEEKVVKDIVLVEESN